MKGVVVVSKKSWLYLGIGTKVFHVIFIITVLVCGKLWMPGSLVYLAITLTVIVQTILLQCPLPMFSTYCFCRYNPEMKPFPSLTLHLYTRFGRIISIPILVFLLIVSTLVGMIWS